MRLQMTDGYGWGYPVPWCRERLFIVVLRINALEYWMKAALTGWVLSKRLLL